MWEHAKSASPSNHQGKPDRLRQTSWGGTWPQERGIGTYLVKIENWKKKWLLEIQCAVITQSNMIWFCTQHYRNWGKTCIRVCAHKIHSSSSQVSYGASVATILETTDHVTTAPHYKWKYTHLALMLHICESVNQVSIGSDNGLAPIRRQPII